MMIDYAEVEPHIVSGGVCRTSHPWQGVYGCGERGSRARLTKHLQAVHAEAHDPTPTFMGDCITSIPIMDFK